MIQPILLFVGIATLILQISDYLQMWQRKEYRLDRLLTSIGTADIKRRLYFFLIYLLFFLIAPRISLPILLLLYTYLAVRRGIYRPDLTLKLIITAGLVLVFSAIIFFLLLINLPVANIYPITIINLLTPFLVALSIPVSNTITSWRKHQYINRAQAHLSQLSPQVVGITGSFGKTSVKHFVAQLAPHIVVSNDRRNSEYVIAKDILEQLSDNTSTYVLEMGAYKAGEITDLARLTKPTIGVITAIGNQHQGVFGSRSGILDAKWELAHSVTDGILILNGDDQMLRERAKQHTGKIIWFGTDSNDDISARNIKTHPRHTDFTLTVKGQEHPIKLPVVGPAALQNTLAAVAITQALGLPIADTIARLSSLKPYSRTMAISSGLAGSTIIDDSYSAGEASVVNALHHLKKFPSSQKIVVMVPIIELGPAASDVHIRLGRTLADTEADVYIYGTDYQSDIKQGYQSNHGRQIKFYTNPRRLKRDLSSTITKESVVLLEGRIPDEVRKFVVTNITINKHGPKETKVVIQDNLNI